MKTRSSSLRGVSAAAAASKAAAAAAEEEEEEEEPRLANGFRNLPLAGAAAGSSRGRRAAHARVNASTI